jgi:hypothetical protein
MGEVKLRGMVPQKINPYEGKFPAKIGRRMT